MNTCVSERSRSALGDFSATRPNTVTNEESLAIAPFSRSAGAASVFLAKSRLRRRLVVCESTPVPARAATGTETLVGCAGAEDAGEETRVDEEAIGAPNSDTGEACAWCWLWGTTIAVVVVAAAAPPNAPQGAGEPNELPVVVVAAAAPPNAPQGAGEPDELPVVEVAAVAPPNAPHGAGEPDELPVAEVAAAAPPNAPQGEAEPKALPLGVEVVAALPKLKPVAAGFVVVAAAASAPNVEEPNEEVG